MLFPTQFSLSVELTNFLPVLRSAGGALLTLARDLRKSGSDIVVEEDLAPIFWRSQIDRNFEISFKKEIPQSDAIPLSQSLQIYLLKGPGPTVIRAFTKPEYFPMVVQLSLLCWSQTTDSLAEGLSEAIRLRAKGGTDVPGTSFNRDSLLGVLRACEEQTSHFPWNLLFSSVRERLGLPSYVPFQAPGFQHPINISEKFETLSVPLLQAALDMLPSVQRFYKNSLMFVEGCKGVCTMVVWAHHALGLSVCVKNCPQGTVCFGDGEANVVIDFADTTPETPPIACLMDDSEQLLLKVQQDRDEPVVEIDAEHKIGARGYAQHVLREFLDDATSVEDMAEMAAALACRFSAFLQDEPLNPTQSTSRARSSLSARVSDVIKASELILGRDDIKDRIVGYSEDLRGKPIFAMLLPQSLCEHNAGAQPGSLSTRLSTPSKDNRSSLVRVKAVDLALVILAFASVGDIEACRGLTLGELSTIATCDIISQVATWDGRSQIRVQHDTWYNLVSRLLSGRKYMDPMQTCLTSNWGWSVYMDSFGDSDPLGVTPGKIWIQHGVPCRDGEIRHAIRNGPKSQYNGPPASRVDGIGQTISPRCEIHVTRAKPSVAIRQDAFVVCSRFGTADGFCSIGYMAMHAVRWDASTTEECHHRISREEVELGLGTATVKGTSWERGGVQLPHERICISLSHGDRHARWLAVIGNRGRTAILRRPDTCLSCSIEQALRIEGDVLLVL